MKLAIITPVLPPYRGGMGTVAFENARMACDAGIRVTLFTPYYDHISRRVPRIENIDGSTIVRLRPFFSYGNAAVLPQLFILVKDADAIHFHYPALGLEIPIIFWALLGKKVVLTYHMDLIGRSSIFRWLFTFYNHTFLPILLRVAKTIFVSSFDYAEHSPVIKKFFVRYKDKIVELPNSVDTERFVPLKNTINNEMCQLRKPYILFVGTMDKAHYSKGVDVLLRAWSHGISHAVFIGGKLVCIGDGDMKNQYEALAHELGVDDSVGFVGAVSDEALPEWIGNAECVVLPSTHPTEAFGIVLLEAGACGLPVIASALPGVRSVVQNGVTGYLVKPHDVKGLAEKIGLILSDEQQTNDMGAAFRRRVDECYSNEVIAKKYIQQIRIFL